MSDLNYKLITKLAESNQALIYKAYDQKDPQRLLTLKIFKAPSLSDYKISQLMQRVEHLRILTDSQIITPILFSSKGKVSFLIQEFFDGFPLNELNRAQARCSLSDFFTAACKLVQILDKIHRAGIIHGGVKPHNILVNPETMEIRVIDFISSIDVRDVTHFIYDRSFVKDTLSYTSPEQTGGINHRVGFSSDLYSLGIVFYELLADRLPFTANDPLELIHSHLAEEAPSVHEINPLVPVQLSKIVAKLMLKEPEKRYQTCSGLLADLVQCRDEYAATGAIHAFPLESQVDTWRTTFVSKIVGRDQETQIILREYEAAVSGSFRSIFISGESGIGKTRLIQELQKHIMKHKCYFISGKFDLFQKNIPYSSLIQAFQNLIRTFLTESDARVRFWRDRILKAVGQNGKVLTEVLPELEILIGPQPEVQTLPPVESLNRFHDLFDRFLTCLASAENPLALFIDDLQWCDSASFDFLENLFLNHQNHPYLFFLGAYRHNEVDSDHPLTKLIQSARGSNRSMREIRLEPLEPAYCHEMVSYILDAPLEQTKSLSDFINMLSDGNPLCVSESLSYLHNENLLFLDEDRQWRWNMEKIRRSNMPNTVVAIFGARIRKLPSDLIDLLEFCACMGNSFSPMELSLIKEMSLTQIYSLLKPALGLGLLIENKDQLQFIHDKVQEATLAGITPERRRQIHWQIGNHLLQAAWKHTAIEKSDNLFTIVSHLNLGKASFLDARTRYLLSDLNYFAGNKALDSLATEAANDYFKLSKALLPDDCWEGYHYDCTFRIFQKVAKTELMCGNYEESERLLTELLEHAKTDLDKAECLAEQTTSLSSVGNFIKAIATANRGLAYFGKAIPESPEEADQKRKELREKIAAWKGDIWETILNMPFTNNRQSEIELAFYSELIPDLYLSGMVPQLYLAAAQSTQHCLAGGMDESVIYSFSIMGLQLSEEGEFAQAFRYEDLARELSARYPNTFGATRGMNGIVWCNMHSRSHPEEIVNYCLKAIQSGKNCGDLYNAGLSYGPLMWNLQVQGADFSLIEDYAKECLEFSNRYHLVFSARLVEAMQAGWIQPMKQDYMPLPMAEILRQWEEDNHIASVGSYYVHRGLTHYYCGEYEAAGRCLDDVRRYLSGLTDSVLKRQWYVFLVLNALKLFEMGQGYQSQAELLAEVRPIIAKIETWAGLGPLLKPYLAFLYAELERVTGDLREARNRYLDAINLAHEQRYIFLEGYLYESLGELLRQSGQSSLRLYFVEAVRLYRKCRAERKELRLIQKYPKYFEEEQIAFKQLQRSLPASILPKLDVDYLIKSSLAIAAEIEQETLLKKVMDVLLESSEAQRWYLLIEADGDLYIRAGSHIGAKQIVRTANERLEDATDICKAIVRFVYRTKERLILNSAMEEGIFKDNQEVQNLQLRSVLCLPVLNQTRMIGILYLENRLANGVFTAEKILLTELLTSQAAISLENARLIEEMKKAEEQIIEALQEKEALLMEVHHRVKNNLQIIQSMLNLQLPYIQDERAVELFKESKNRIYLMALIHEKLYHSESLARIDLPEYIQSLINNLFLSYGVSERNVRTEICIEPVTLNVDTIIPCALIINELVSNSLKHAFRGLEERGGGTGEIQIKLRRDFGSKFILTVSDNGSGMPQGFEVQNCQSLGLKLVNVLVKQLNGDIILSSNGRTEFTITFTELKRSRRLTK